MKSKNIKMIALDLDGTVLDSSKRVTERTEAAFRAAMKKGIYVVISTGRTFTALPKQLYEIDGLRYMVTSNGAQITDIVTGKVVYEKMVPEEAVEAVISMVCASDEAQLEAFIDGRAYIDRADFENLAENGSKHRDVEYIKSTRNPVDNLAEFVLANRSRVENMSLNYENPELRTGWRAALAEIPGITVTSSLPFNIEIGGTDSSKAAALKVLMQLLGIESSELMACGDSFNDLSMIQLAGIGVVMGNAEEEMKQYADYVPETNDNDGVAAAIEKFAL